MHSNNTVCSVHFTSRVLKVKVTYSECLTCCPFSCDVHRMKFYVVCREGVTAALQLKRCPLLHGSCGLRFS